MIYFTSQWNYAFKNCKKRTLNFLRKILALIHFGCSVWIFRSLEESVQENFSRSPWIFEPKMYVFDLTDLSDIIWGCIGHLDSLLDRAQVRIIRVWTPYIWMRSSNGGPLHSKGRNCWIIFTPPIPMSWPTFCTTGIWRKSPWMILLITI